MAVVTGDIITDAVVNLKAALDTQRSSWGVSEVYRYQAHEAGVRGDAIAIEVLGWQPQIVQHAGTIQDLAHKVTLRVWYIKGIGFKEPAAFDAVYSKLSKIIAYLIENPRPNGYGELLLDDQAFGPTVEAITRTGGTGGSFVAGQFRLVYTYFKSHTLTL